MGSGGEATSVGSKGEEGIREEVNLTRGAGVIRDGGIDEVAPVVGE